MHCFYKHNILFEPLHHPVTCATAQKLLLSALSTAMLSVALVELALVEVQTTHSSRCGTDAAQQFPGCSGASAAKLLWRFSKPHSSST